MTRLNKAWRIALILLLIIAPIGAYIGCQILFDFPIPEFIGGVFMLIALVLIFLLTMRAHFFESDLNRGIQVVWLKKPDVAELERDKITGKIKAAIANTLIDLKLRKLKIKARLKEKKKRKNDNRI